MIQNITFENICFKILINKGVNENMYVYHFVYDTVLIDRCEEIFSFFVSIKISKIFVELSNNLKKSVEIFFEFEFFLKT